MLSQLVLAYLVPSYPNLLLQVKLGSRMFQSQHMDSQGAFKAPSPGWTEREVEEHIETQIRPLEAQAEVRATLRAQFVTCQKVTKCVILRLLCIESHAHVYL